MLNLLICLAAIVILFVVLKILGKSMKIITTFLVNALVGVIVLFVLSFIFPSIFVVNTLNAILVGFLGVPGLILVAILSFIL